MQLKIMLHTYIASFFNVLLLYSRQCCIHDTFQHMKSTNSSIMIRSDQGNDHKSTNRAESADASEIEDRGEDGYRLIEEERVRSRNLVWTPPLEGEEESTVLKLEGEEPTEVTKQRRMKMKRNLVTADEEEPVIELEDEEESDEEELEDED
ncbi:hypothetical protein CRG98_043253 [Punica granatum]|uniref:Uncharacterized protein n=1 Tax=Punica granatum TaxID=22663 RepID=A0A2I0HXC4_PUNGR|nr:hypothetical protein CRG98_043253 [Punica granatum]